MRTGFKIIAFAMLTAMLLCFMCLTCFADSNPSGESSLGESTNTSDFTVSEESEANKAAQEDTESIFSVMFNYIKVYASELLCALTLICSVILTFAYKRGLFPIVKNGVGALAGAVKKIGESTDRSEECSKKLTDTVSERMTAVEGQLSILKDAINKLNLTATPTQEDIARIHNFSAVILEQLQLTNEIFASLALPQKLKEAVVEKLTEMKDTVKKYGNK